MSKELVHYCPPFFILRFWLTLGPVLHLAHQKHIQGCEFLQIRCLVGLIFDSLADAAHTTCVKLFHSMHYCLQL